MLANSLSGGLTTLAETAANVINEGIKAHKPVKKYDKNRVIATFQSNLGNIRIIGDIKIEALTDIFEVSRQSIWNIETGKTKMNMAQFLAWYSVFNQNLEELEKNGDPIAKIFKRCLEICIDENGSYSDEELEKYRLIIDQIARLKKAGVDQDIIDTIAKNLFD